MAGVPQKDRCTCSSKRSAEAPKAQKASALTNEGPIDRATRVGLGAAVLSLGSSTPWAWLGLIPLVTGLIGFCPLYRVFGISTAGKPGRT